MPGRFPETGFIPFEFIISVAVQDRSGNFPGRLLGKIGKQQGAVSEGSSFQTRYFNQLAHFFV